MNNILITGANGQLGKEFGVLTKKEENFFLFGKDDLDITNKKSILEVVEKNKIDVIVNCAAYTAVDKAENEKELAENINRYAVKNLGEIVKEKDLKLIHISTDYVFSGENFKPYLETDKTNPQSTYGATKLSGEEELLNLNLSNSCIIRTSWVYSSFGNNFVKTMLHLGKEREELGVVCDQVGTPTYARDLAKTIIKIIPQLENKKTELYNYSNEGVLSWYDFAKEIMKMAKIECGIKPIESKDYPTPAKRPHFSLLNKGKIKKDFQVEIPFWKDSLDSCLRELKER